MLKSSSRFTNITFQIGAILLALAFTTLILLLAGAPPIQAFLNIIWGAFGSLNSFANVLVAAVPLLLATSGLMITFAAGLWNIGVEGQIVLGAIFTTGVLRFFQDSSLPPWSIITLGILAGAVGGSLWAAVAGALKTFGGVNEIFGGLGLNFVASSLTLWLIFGPWKPPGIASVGGTKPFPPQLGLPPIENLRISAWSLVIAAVSVAIVFMILQGTHFGLRLKAIGKNMRASFLLGIPTTRYMMAAFMICGVFAGLAGAIQVTGVYNRLNSSISSGYGFMGLLIAMLVSYRALWAVPVVLFFAALNIGSIQLPIVLKLDSSLSGVLQGALVLFVVIMQGIRQRLASKV
jgi:simple sugar transport system permease protein